MRFCYVASDTNGKRVKAIADTDSVAGLISRLKKQGLTPIRIYKPNVSLAKNKFLLQRRVKGAELAVFTRQLCAVLSSGVLLIDALKTLSEDMENHYFGGIIKRIVSEINGGDSFSEALLHYPAVFPAVYIAIIKSGEENGNLGRTLENLAKYLENYEAMKEKVVSALRYPLLVIFFATIVVSVIVLVIIPKFSVLFIHAGAKLPLLTRVVVESSMFFLRHIPAIFAGILIILIIVRYLFTIFKVRFAWDYFQLKMPVFGKIVNKVVLSRFCRTLSALLSGGVPMVLSIKVSNEVAENLFMRHVFEQIKKRVASGESLSYAMKSYGIIPSVLMKMVTVGEKSGRLDDMLKRTADYYDQELDIVLNKMSSMIEPVLIIIIGAVVLVVALALYLPIFRLSMAIR